MEEACSVPCRSRWHFSPTLIFHACTLLCRPASAMAPLSVSRLHKCWHYLQPAATALEHAPGLLIPVRSRRARSAACLRVAGVIRRDVLTIMALIGDRSVSPDIVGAIRWHLERGDTRSGHLALARFLVTQVRPCLFSSCEGSLFDCGLCAVTICEISARTPAPCLARAAAEQIVSLYADRSMAAAGPAHGPHLFCLPPQHGSR